MGHLLIAKTEISLNNYLRKDEHYKAFFGKRILIRIPTFKIEKATSENQVENNFQDRNCNWESIKESG